MKRIVFGSFLVLFLFTISSCTPFTREKYLEQYKLFMDQVTENSINYSEQDWRNADKKYARFNNEWYNKYKDDFTWKEKMLIADYKVRYNMLKAGIEIGNSKPSKFKR